MDSLDQLLILTNQFMSEMDYLVKDCYQALSWPIYRTISLLIEHGSLTQFELAQLSRLDKSTISRHIKNLLKMRYITISKQHHDKRFKQLFLTAKAKEAYKRTRQHLRHQFDRVHIKLNQDESSLVFQGMQIYTNALKQQRILSEYRIRLIKKEDNTEMMSVIRQVLREFGADKPGFAYVDPELLNLAKTYHRKRYAYYIIERVSDMKIVGGAGIGPLKGSRKNIGELQKMYLLPEVRGLKLGLSLLNWLVAEAKRNGYDQIYLETLKNMERANQLYIKNGFEKLKAPLGKTGHFGCDAWYVRKI